MNLLCLSNGHGEDAIAVRILKELRQLPQAPTLRALPMVGEGGVYDRSGITRLGPTRSMPSGGFIYMDGRQVWGDLREGLIGLTLDQWRTIRSWAREGGKIFAVGDVVPLALAWASGAEYAFLGTAKSQYQLAQPTPATSDGLPGWLGSVYFPWERWLMAHPRCQRVFVRDQRTADTLQTLGVPASYVGNPMMDGLGVNPQTLATLTASFADCFPSLTLALVPGSRAPEAFDNWQRILASLASVQQAFADRQLRLLAAISPALNLAVFKESLREAGWQPQPGPYPGFCQGRHQLLLTQDAFAESLHLADAVIATAGTATEQAVGLGKPVFTLPGKGPQFTPAFAAIQQRLLGESLTVVSSPLDLGLALHQCLGDSARLQAIAANGSDRMGSPGAARSIALVLQSWHGQPDPLPSLKP